MLMSLDQSRHRYFSPDSGDEAHRGNSRDHIISTLDEDVPDVIGFRRYAHL